MRRSGQRRGLQLSAATLGRLKRVRARTPGTGWIQRTSVWPVEVKGILRKSVQPRRSKKGAPPQSSATRTPTIPQAPVQPDPATRSVKLDESKNQVVEIPAAMSTTTPSASSQASELREVLNEAVDEIQLLDQPTGWLDSGALIDYDLGPWINGQG